MRVVQTAFGRAEDVLEFEEGVAGTGELEVEVLAAPVLPMDRLRIGGHYPLAQTLPGTPGSVGVGRIDSGPRVGEVVCLPMRAGSWAQRVRVDEADCLPVHGDPVRAALLRVNGLTAQALIDGLERNQWLLVNAANGGVGHYVCELARRMGVRVAAVVRREMDVNADVVLVDGPDLAERLQEAGVQAHRALDGVGGDATARLGSALQEGGRVLHYGAMSRQRPCLQVADSIFRGVLLQGFWLYKHDTRRGQHETARILNRMLELDLPAVPHTCFALSDVHAALGHERAVLTPDRMSTLPTA